MAGYMDIAFSSGPDTGRKYAHTLGEVRKGAWPSPVYEAHFDDGTIGRMSFWSRDGKHLDFDRGRRVVTRCHLWCDKRIVVGYVGSTTDPFFTNGATEQPSRPKRRNGKELEAALQGLVDKLPLCVTVEARRVLGKAA